MRKVPSELGWLELPHDNQSSARKALPVQVSHRFTPASAVFDDEHLVSCAGLVPVMTLAAQTGLPTLLADKIDIAVPRIKAGSANPSPKLTTVIVYTRTRRSEPGCESSPSGTPVSWNQSCVSTWSPCASVCGCCAAPISGHSSTSTHCCARSTDTPHKAPATGIPRSPGNRSCAKDCPR